MPHGSNNMGAASCVQTWINSAMTYESPMLIFKTCNGQTEHNGQPHAMMDEAITGHKLHCPDRDKHLTSLLLCPDCGTRYAVIRTRDSSRVRPT